MRAPYQTLTILYKRVNNNTQRDKDGSEIYKVKTNFNMPLKKNILKLFTYLY